MQAKGYVQGAVDSVVGGAKNIIGSVTGNQSQEAEGKTQQKGESPAELPDQNVHQLVSQCISCCICGKLRMCLQLDMSTYPHFAFGTSCVQISACICVE